MSVETADKAIDFFFFFYKTMIPDIKDSTKEERESYIKDRFKCISDCDSCGICAMYKNQDPLLVYKDYIDGVRDFQDITNDYR